MQIVQYQIKFLIALIFFINSGQVSGQINLLKNRLASSTSYQDCNPPYSLNCCPFETIVSPTPQSLISIAGTIIGQLICDFKSLTIEELASLLYFNVYQNNETVKVVPGLKFYNNASAFVNVSNPCIVFFVGGFTSDTFQNADDVAKTYDWRTHCAAYLYRYLGCTVIVVNWGALTFHDYACLAKYILPKMGKLLAAILLKFFIVAHITLIGHSFGAHICGFACSEIQFNGLLVYKLISLDAAGPLIKYNQCYVRGIIQSGMSANIASITIHYSTDPCRWGSGNKTLAKVNVDINPSMHQPGYNENPAYDHVFAIMFCGALCAKTVVRDSASSIDLNGIYNDNIPSGHRISYTNACYPFYCPTKLNESLK